MKLKLLISTLLLFITFTASSKPKFSVVYNLSIDGFTQIKVVNETTKELLCHIAIDGKKIKFRLLPLYPSIWYKATDKRFNYTNFSTWCDYIDLYPEYKNIP